MPSLRLARACATVSIRVAEQARAQALNLLGVIEAGADPVAERRTERAVRTFHEVAEDFMAQHVLDKCKARTAESYRCLLDKYVLPELGEKGIIDIGGADVARLHSSLGEILRQECYLSREELRELQGMRLHVLRHSFPSIGAGASLGPTVGKLLGHSQPTTTNRYSHPDANPLRHAANAISTSIAAALAGAKGARLGNPCVV